MPAELDKVLYQIANAEWTKAAATRMFSQDLTQALEVMNQLACNVQQREVPVTETLSLFFEPGAVKVLLANSANLFWFWLLVQESVEQSRGHLPVEMEVVRFARGVLRQRMQDRGVTIGLRPADMSVHEMGTAMAFGTVLVLQVRKEDGVYRHLIANPIFAEEKEKTGSDSDCDHSTREDLSSERTADPAGAAGLRHADPDARSIQQEFGPPSDDEAVDFFVLLEGRQANGEKHAAVLPASADEIVRYLEGLNGNSQ